MLPETENLDQYASRKLDKKKAHFIIGNLAQDALGADLSELTLYSPTEAPVRLEKMNKLESAQAILTHIAQHA